MQDLLIAAVVRLQNSWFRVRDAESGQGLVEYALIVAVVSLGLIMAPHVLLKRSITGVFSKAGSSISQVTVG